MTSEAKAREIGWRPRSYHTLLFVPWRVALDKEEGFVKREI